MSFCTQCGSQNEDGVKFCCNCGAQMEQPEVKPEVQTEVPVEVQPEVQAEVQPEVKPEEVTPVYEKVTDAEVVPPVANQQEDIKINYGADNSSNYSSNFDSTQPQYYATPDQNQAPTTKGNKGVAIASLICGILSLVCCCLSIFSLILGVAAVVLGIITICNNFDGKGMAIAGIATGGIGICIWLAAIIFSGTAFYTELTDELLDSLN